MRDLTAAFEQHRPRLRAEALRLLGSAAEADDVVQEAWVRLRNHCDGRPDDLIGNLGGWLTTVVARLALDHLRRRTTRREEPLDALTDQRSTIWDPQADAELAEQVGDALLVVLDTLSPAERVAFVLHDLFGVPFDEVARMLGRTAAAARQLASRGRRRVRTPDAVPHADRRTQQQVVESFLAASRSGDFSGLLELLDPGAVIRADHAALRMGADAETRGAVRVAETFSGRAQAAVITELDGYAAAVWAVDGTPIVVFGFVLDGDRITEIELLADPDTIARLDLATGGLKRDK